MYNPRILLSVFSKHKQKLLKSVTNVNAAQVLNKNISYEKANTADTARSLFFTNLPKKKREKRAKIKVGHIPSGSLIIQCKNKSLDHYSGMHYGKFDVIPLASKGWYHRRSKGDYFTILPSKPNPAFVSKEDLISTFEETGVSEKMVQQLKQINVTQPTVIQARSLENLLKGRNVFISAECGSGKTLAYLIATIENVYKLKNEVSNKCNSPFAIILLPTKELALQVGQLASTLSSELGIICQTLIGGDIQQLLLRPRADLVDILICTPLVINKHLRANLYSTEVCRHVVFDEADTLVEEDFFEQMKQFAKVSKVIDNISFSLHFPSAFLCFLDYLLAFSKFQLNFTGLYNPTDLTGQGAQICFVSATAPSKMIGRLQELVKAGDIITISTQHLHKVVNHIPQLFMRVAKPNRATELLKIAKNVVKQKIPTLIFCNKQVTSNWVSHFLCENGINCPKINQTSRSLERFHNFRLFQQGDVDVISCTDLASRGLHFDRVVRIINFEFPSYMADYIHRCGRVGRLGQTDNCLIMNFISSKHEISILNKIEIAVRTNTPLTNIYNDRRAKLQFLSRKKKR